MRAKLELGLEREEVLHFHLAETRLSLYAKVILFPFLSKREGVVETALDPSFL